MPHEPSIWEIIASIGTLAAVVVALASPFIVAFFHRRREKNAIVKAIKTELSTIEKDFRDLQRNIKEDENFTRNISEVRQMCCVLSDMDIQRDIWDTFKLNLAKLDHDKFITFNELYSHLAYLKAAARASQNGNLKSLAAHHQVSRHFERFLMLYAKTYGLEPISA